MGGFKSVKLEYCMAKSSLFDKKEKGADEKCKGCQQLYFSSIKLLSIESLLSSSYGYEVAEILFRGHISYGWRQQWREIQNYPEMRVDDFIVLFYSISLRHRISYRVSCLVVRVLTPFKIEASSFRCASDASICLLRIQLHISRSSEGQKIRPGNSHFQLAIQCAQSRTIVDREETWRERSAVALRTFDSTYSEKNG